MELGQLVDERLGHVEHVLVLGAEEAAAGGVEVLEDHDERVVGVVVGRVPDLRHPHRQLVADRGVQLRLGHARGRPSSRNSRCSASNGWSFTNRVSGTSPSAVTRTLARPVVPRVGVDDLDRGHVGAEHLAQPAGRELVDGCGDGHGTLLGADGPRPARDLANVNTDVGFDIGPRRHGIHTDRDAAGTMVR